MAESYIGEIRMFAGNFAPRGWQLCQGQILSISTNAALFSILGTTYGGDGRVTFGLPDLRGRVPVGVGQGPGLNNVQQGEQGGINTQTLTLSNAPANVVQIPGPTLSIAIPAVEGDANASAPSTGAVLAKATDSAGTGAAVEVYSNATPNTTLQPFTVTAPPVNVNVGGGSTPFSVQNPYLGMNFIICVEGIYPSRN
ncbi:Phage Tail Collar Domain protein [compost metagenome]